MKLGKIRKLLGALFFLLITLLFLDFTGTAHAYLAWLAEIQLIPAVLAINVVVIASLVLLTLLFGRVYCSVICPLGVFQDIVAKFGRRGKKMPYAYSKPRRVLRYGFLALFVVAIIMGIGAIVSVLDPYAAYGRMANNLLQPLWMWCNNLFAYLAERLDSYAFYEVSVWVKSAVAFSVAALTLLVVGFMAYKGGRTYCNTVCPVGTLLGVMSRFSIFRVRIDQEKCNKCGICAGNCKASCIDHKNFKVDSSRCVACFKCMPRCKKGAITYTATSKSSYSTASSDETRDDGRRGFLAGVLAVGVVAAKAQVLPKTVDLKVDGGLADITDKKSRKLDTPITPPGSKSVRNFTRNCTACQLCVSACPNGVLQPSNSFDNFMQPVMSFAKGYCRAECVRCSEVCPSNAIAPIDVAQKSATQIGRAVWKRGLCRVVSEGDSCDNCSRQCPTKAITMVDRGFKHPVPMIDTERCIGCGACENLCPSRPYSAIYVVGNVMHREI